MSAPEFVSDCSFEKRIERLIIGHTHRSEVEALPGPERTSERNRWSYYTADTEFGVDIRRYTSSNCPIPMSAGPSPTNTCGVIRVTCDDAGIAKQLEVSRFFEQPYINEYWFLVKEDAK